MTGDAYSRQLDCSTVSQDNVQITITAMVAGQSYSASIGVQRIRDTLVAAYGGVSDTLLTSMDGEPLAIGDTFLYMPMDGEEYDDTDPLFGHVLKWGGNSWESTTDSKSIGLAAKDAFQIARESGKVIFAAVIYTEAMVAANIQAGSGTGLADSGFRFRAMDDDYSQEGAPKVPVFDVMVGDKVLFKVDIPNGYIYFGPHFIYDPEMEEIRSTSGLFKIGSDGQLSITNGVATNLTVEGLNALSGDFKGQLDTITIKTILGSGTYTTAANYSGNLMATDMYSGIYCTVGVVPLDTLIVADGTVNGKTISKVKFYTPWYTYDRYNQMNGPLYRYYSFTKKHFKVDIVCTDSTVYSYTVVRVKSDYNTSTYPTSKYPPYPTFNSSICSSLTEGDVSGYTAPYSITNLRIKDPTLEELYIYNLPAIAPSDTGRVWKDGSGYLRIV